MKAFMDQDFLLGTDTRGNCITGMPNGCPS